MKTISSILVLFLCLTGCKTWEYGDVYYQHIDKGEHYATPSLTLHFTEVWGGKCILEYDSEQMIDLEYNFSYWNKLGGLMPDITDNIGEHQSARLAWRVDPEDTNYFYVGYISYVNNEVERGYLLGYDEEKLRIAVGDEFDARVNKYTDHWGVHVRYGGYEAFKRINDNELKRERFVVVMDMYYGGIPAAPTDIDLTIEVVDTKFIY